MLLSEFLTISSQLENTSSTLEKISTITPHCKDPFFLSLLTMPRINIGSQIIIQALSTHTGFTTKEIKADYILEGRLSTVVHNCLTHKKVQPLSAFFGEPTSPPEDPHTSSIYLTLLSLSNNHLPSKKIEVLNTLFSYTTSPHLINIITGDRALGVSYANIYKGISPEHAQIRHAHALCNNWFILLSNLSDLSLIQPKVLFPISPQLLKSGTLSDHTSSSTIEVKYDGVRIQAHGKDNKLELFTRELENKTSSVPDFIDDLKHFQKINDIHSFIFDLELLAYKGEHELLPAECVLKRLGKHNTGKRMRQVKLECRIFDVLHLNGKSTLHLPQQERRKILNPFTHTENICIAQTLDHLSPEEAFSYAIQKHEGVVIKPNTPYNPGTREGIKVKPLLPTFDLIITKALYGKGKNANTYSSFIVSASQNDELIEVCSVGGFSNPELKLLTSQINNSPHEKTSSSVTILNPSTLIEVKADKVHNKNGIISLRFPRKHSIRTDKHEITTLDEIRRHIK